MKKNIWGILLIVLGVIIGLNRLNITNINLFFDGWWTLFIIIPSIFGLFDKEDKTISFIMLIIGVLLLLSVRGVIDFSKVIDLIFPGILITIGLSMLFKNTINRVDIPEVKNKEEYYATFSHQKITLDGHYNGCDLNAVFGGINFDLRDAKIKNNSVVKAWSIFGGIDLIVPDDVKVVVRSTSIFGGVDNKTKNNKDTGKVLYIDAICLFGGLEVKNEN